MKKVILALAILFGVSSVTFAQTTGQAKKENEKKEMNMKMKDGVMMVKNKPMLCSDNKCTPLTKTYTCSDGCKVSADGTITKPDGSSMKLKNGYMIAMDGKVSMIPHGEEGHVCDASCPMHKKM